jgi:hypothetical protein
MATKKKPKKPEAKKTGKKDYVVVSNRGYGKKLKGTKIYFEGPKPTKLRADGAIKFGKHILETLGAKYSKFRWIITRDTDSIETTYGITRVRTSLRLLDKMDKEEWDRNRDIKNTIVRRFFSIAYPLEFAGTGPAPYVPGTLGGMLDIRIIPRLSSEDRDALRRFVPEFIATESVGMVNALKATTQINSLRALAEALAGAINESHGESWWQDFIKGNILLMQQGYIKAIEKLNVVLGRTKFPDFALVAHDNYLDILEIKRPDSSMLKEDPGRGNFYWDPEMNKAIIQTENYIESVSQHGHALRSYLKDNHDLDVKTLRPRGIILAGDARHFDTQKKRDDFRLLSQGIKNITFLTYDELLTRLNNYIAVLEDFSKDQALAVTPDAQADTPEQPLLLQTTQHAHKGAKKK